MERFVNTLTRGLAYLFFVLIRIYQLIISPYLGKHCRFEPSCSTYALQAIQHYGPIRGMWFSMLRLLRCQPWAKAGHDPIPFKKEI